MDIIKRDGHLQEFDINKVIKSITDPMSVFGEPDTDFALKTAMYIQDKVYSNGSMSTDQIHDLVTEALMKLGNVGVLKQFVTWRFT